MSFVFFASVVSYPDALLVPPRGWGGGPLGLLGQHHAERSRAMADCLIAWSALGLLPQPLVPAL